jgi:hypothetical protein
MLQIKDYQTLIDHISQCLRPGGLVELLEFDFRVYSASFKPFSFLDDTMEPPWFPRWMSLINMAVRQRGGSPDAANMLHSRTLQHQAFEDVVYEEYFIPTAPFMSHQEPNYRFLRTISEMFRDDIQVCGYGYPRLPHPHHLHSFVQSFLRSGRPLLLGSGFSEPLVDELQHRANLELKEARTVSYIRVERVYARKRS